MQKMHSMHDTVDGNKFTPVDMGRLFFFSFHEGCTYVPDGAGCLPTFYVINPKSRYPPRLRARPQLFIQNIYHSLGGESNLCLFQVPLG